MTISVDNSYLPIILILYFYIILTEVQKTEAVGLLTLNIMTLRPFRQKQPPIHLFSRHIKKCIM